MFLFYQWLNYFNYFYSFYISTNRTHERSFELNDYVSITFRINVYNFCTSVLCTVFQHEGLGWDLWCYVASKLLNKYNSNKYGHLNYFKLVQGMKSMKYFSIVILMKLSELIPIYLQINKTSLYDFKYSIRRLEIWL